MPYPLRLGVGYPSQGEELQVSAMGVGCTQSRDGFQDMGKREEVTRHSRWNEIKEKTRFWSSARSHCLGLDCSDWIVSGLGTTRACERDELRPRHFHLGIVV